jgi:hypothetical protein
MEGRIETYGNQKEVEQQKEELKQEKEVRQTTRQLRGEAKASPQRFWVC